mmetsp:Transcript_4180/g.15027  ORF Transcript_4180/g.15027 Transcript_4180/m.15027 type:complete len:245 (-) Transcript_4180:134-868(-)
MKLLHPIGGHPPFAQNPIHQKVTLQYSFQLGLYLEQLSQGACTNGVVDHPHCCPVAHVATEIEVAKHRVRSGGCVVHAEDSVVGVYVGAVLVAHKSPRTAHHCTEVVLPSLPRRKRHLNVVVVAVAVANDDAADAAAVAMGCLACGREEPLFCGQCGQGEVSLRQTTAARCVCRFREVLVLVQIPGVGEGLDGVAALLLPICEKGLAVDAHVSLSTLASITANMCSSDLHEPLLLQRFVQFHSV